MHRKAFVYIVLLLAIKSIAVEILKPQNMAFVSRFGWDVNVSYNTADCPNFSCYLYGKIMRLDGTGKTWGLRANGLITSQLEESSSAPYFLEPNTYYSLYFDYYTFQNTVRVTIGATDQITIKTLPSAPTIIYPSNYPTGPSREAYNYQDGVDTTNGIFSWHSVVGATGYDFQIVGEANGSTIRTISNLQDTSFSLSTSNETDSISYSNIYWRVRARFSNSYPDSSDWSCLWKHGATPSLRYNRCYSEVAFFKPTLPSPVLVSPAQSASIEGTQVVNFNWNSMVQKSSLWNYYYQIQISQSSSFATIDTSVSGSLTDSSKAIFLKKGGGYYWRMQTFVQTSNGTYRGAWSDVHQFNLAPSPIESVTDTFTTQVIYNLASNKFDCVVFINGNPLCLGNGYYIGPHHPKTTLYGNDYMTAIFLESNTDHFYGLGLGRRVIANIDTSDFAATIVAGVNDSGYYNSSISSMPYKLGGTRSIFWDGSSLYGFTDSNDFYRIETNSYTKVHLSRLPDTIGLSIYSFTEYDSVLYFLSACAENQMSRLVSYDIRINKYQVLAGNCSESISSTSDPLTSGLGLADKLTDIKDSVLYFISYDNVSHYHRLRGFNIFTNSLILTPKLPNVGIYDIFFGADGELYFVSNSSLYKATWPVKTSSNLLNNRVLGIPEASHHFIQQYDLKGRRVEESLKPKIAKYGH